MRTRRAVAGLATVVLVVGCAAACTGSGTRTGDAPAGDGAARQRPSDAPSAATAPSAGDRARPPSPRPDPLAPALDEAPRPPRSPRQAATQITAAEGAIADRGTSARRLAAAGHTQQLAYRVVSDRPGWDDRVAAHLPRRLRRVAADNIAAMRAFRSMHPTRPGDLATELPAWRIVAPRPARELRHHYREAQRRYGVEWEYLAAIHLVETRFGRIDGTSVAGAQGPMQFIPTTWDLYGRGGDVHDPRDAILAAGRLLRANGFADDPSGALYRYNNHPAYVRGVTLHAEIMQRRPRAFLGYHQWPVYYLTRHRSVWLPEGYAERRPVPVAEYLADRRRG